MQQKIRIAICEDDETERDYIRSLVTAWGENMGRECLVDGYTSAEQLLFSFEDTLPYSMYILDIQMGKLNGMELAKKIRQRDQAAVILFLTGLRDYALEGYEVGAMRYLIKPVREEELFSILTLVAQLLVLYRCNQKYKQMQQDNFENNIEANTKLTALTAPIYEYAHGKDIRMSQLDISYVKGYWEYTKLVTDDMMSLHRKGGKLMAASTFSSAVLSILCYIYVGMKALSGVVTVGNMAKYVSAFTKFGVALVGPNGAGKTTFIKLLCRLYDPTEGEILLNGIDIRLYDYDEYIQLFSVVFQDFSIFSFSIAENVAASREFDEERVRDCLIKAGFRKRLAELDKDIHTNLYQLEDDGVEISGGEAQKIAIARALYKEAPFVILDEPTSALDPKAEYEIYRSFNELVEKKTAIYISHRMSSCRFCQEILVFDQGRIVEQGSHKELVADTGGLYHEMWNAQAKYYK